MSKKLVLAALMLAALAVGGTAAAGNGGGSGRSASSISLVMMGSATATSAAPASPTLGPAGHVRRFDQRDCVSVGDGDVSAERHSGVSPVRFFYPAPASPMFTLSSYAWAGGAAECTADLYYVNAKGASVTLASTSFSVES